MTSKSAALRFGSLSSAAVHICVDMQRLFAEETDWKTPWMARVLPNVVRLVEAHSPRTIFTRFIPAERPGEGQGVWKRYWRRWAGMTLEAMGHEMADLVPELARHVPPATVIDKKLYSPWVEPALDDVLRQRSVDTLVITGGETDFCVLATVLGAIDRGYRVIVVTDALCSASDETHDALMTLYEKRYSQQVETVSTEVVLAAWR
jgi:nicotinamidase-related amidase